MDDAFLYRYRKPPRPAFERALRARLFAPARPAFSITLNPVRQMARSLATIGAVFVVAFAISPDMRARVRARVVGTE
jgi:hypothetical protein